MKTESCIHHWKVESPDGNPTVHGTCRKCGSERDFVVFAEPDPASFMLLGAYAARRRAAA